MQDMVGHADHNKYSLQRSILSVSTATCLSPRPRPQSLLRARSDTVADSSGQSPAAAAAWLQSSTGS